MKYNKEDLNKSGIYVIKNTITNKVYVGKSKNILSRIEQHVTLLNTRSKDENIHLIHSWHKYGRDAFTYFVIEYTSKLKERELFWILKLNALDRDKGYNLRLDTSTNCVVSQETRRRQSESGKQRYINDPEQRVIISKRAKKFWSENPEIKEGMKEKVSKNHTKYSICQFTRDSILVKEYPTQLYLRKNYPDLYLPAILQVCNGNKASYKNFYWRYKDIETGEIIKQPFRRKLRKPVNMYDKESNSLLMSFASATEAARCMGYASSTNISKMCINKTFYKTKSYYFRFTEDIVQPHVKT